MKILITGAAGYTGSRLILPFEGKHELRLMDIHPFDTPHEKVIGDVTDLNTVCKAVDGVDAIMIGHMAPQKNDGYALPTLPFDVNVRGTRLLMEASQRAGVPRFVHCSTVGVQGDIKNPPAREEDPYSPGDHYQDSKVEGEELALAFHRDQGLAVSVVRPTGIYGPGDTRFLKLFRALRKGRFVMIGSGKVLYHLTYIDDLVQGFILAGEKEAAIGQVFTIGAEATEVADDGRISYTFEYNSADVISEGAMPEVVAYMEEQHKTFIGLKGNGVISDRNIIESFTMDIPETADPSVAQNLDSMQRSMREFSTPFPEEAMGVGGKWQVVNEVNNMGMENRSASL